MCDDAPILDDATMFRLLEEMRAAKKAGREMVKRAKEKAARKLQYKPRDITYRGHSYLVALHVRSRNAGSFDTPEQEIFELNKLLENDGLTSNERRSFNRRKRKLQEKIAKGLDNQHKNA
jgi:hypothetical protein